VKIDARQVQAFLKGPLTARAVLLHGDDAGLIRERGSILTKRVAGSLSDPFQVAELERAGWARLADEMSAISMMGGRRVVRVRDVTDAILEPLKLAMKGAGDALIVLEAPELGRGKLRSFAEAAQHIACLPCYPEEGTALHDSIRRMLSDRGYAADAETIGWIAEAIGSNRSTLVGDLERMCLLAGDGGRVDLDTARSCADDLASASADAGLIAATQGELAACDHDLERAVAEGLNGIALIRSALSHLQKLQQARLLMATGLSAGDAVRTLRPPIFFKLAGGMINSVQLWSLEHLARAIEEARQVEIACKQTGARQDLLVRRFVSGLARQAQARRRARMPATGRSA
jgi:DNA polymerase-3 subunit delta